MIRKQQKNLKTQNEEFLEYLAENEMSYGEYEWLKQEKADAINK